MELFFCFFDRGEFSPAGNPLRVHKAGLLMLKFRGLYLHSDMLSNGGGGGERGGGTLSGQNSGEDNSLSEPWLAPNQRRNLRLNR